MLDRLISTSVSLPIGIYVELRERAEREQRSMASVVREIVRRELEREDADEDRQHNAGRGA